MTACVSTRLMVRRGWSLVIRVNRLVSVASITGATTIIVVIIVFVIFIRRRNQQNFVAPVGQAVDGVSQCPEGQC